MRVAVGMSRGVESSVCALLMKELAEEVIGVTLRFHQVVSPSTAHKLFIIYQFFFLSTLFTGPI